jgi:membrane protein
MGISASRRAAEAVRAFKASIVGRLVDRYTKDQGWFLAAAVAYNALFSMLPIVVLVVTLLGVAFRDPATLGKAIAVLAEALPAEASTPMLEVVRTSSTTTDLWGVISLVGLLWIGVGLFNALEEALDRVYGVQERSFFAQRLMGIVMILIFAVLIVLQIAATGAAQLVVSVAGVIPLVGPNLAPFIPLAGYVVSAAAASILCLAVLYVVPNLRLAIRDTLPGTLFATVALVVLAQAFPLYARLSASTSQYGQIFGFALLLMTWSYLVAHAFIVGAELNVVLCPPCVPADRKPKRPAGAAVQQNSLEASASGPQRKHARGVTGR